MAEKTGISWTDSTFNPWIGCTRVSPACDHCYAARSTPARTLGVAWGPGADRRRTSEANWKLPKTWNSQPFVECMECGWRGEARKAREVGAEIGVPGFEFHAGAVLLCPSCKSPTLKEARRRVFCASLADVFDNEVPKQWREDLFTLIRSTPHLDWLLLTKRIGNATAMIEAALSNMDIGYVIEFAAWPWPNVWLGSTICNQPEYDRDIGRLLRIPAARHFLSVEPMLSAIDMRMGGASMPTYFDHRPLKQLDWVICGGESGPHARPMQPEWARSLRDQCAADGVPFFFKQWGGLTPTAGGCMLDDVEYKAWPEAGV